VPQIGGREEITVRSLVRGAGEGFSSRSFRSLSGAALVNFILGLLFGSLSHPRLYRHLHPAGYFFLAFIGGFVAARRGTHLTLSTAAVFSEGRFRRFAGFFSCCVAASVTAVLTYAAVGVVIAERMQGQKLTVGLPVWVSESVMPLGLGLIALVYILRSSPHWIGRACATAVAGAVFSLGLIGPSDAMVWALGALLRAATLLGSPVFAAMAGLGLMLFWREGTPVAAVLPPKFTAGRISTCPDSRSLSRNGLCSRRIKNKPHATRATGAISFMPFRLHGRVGVAGLVAVVCALCTALTGQAWGVTIIALGAFLPHLPGCRLPQRFSLGKG